MKIMHVLNSSSYSGAENVVITIIKRFKEKYKDECLYVSPIGEIKQRLAKEEVEYKPLNKLTIKEVKRVIKEYRPDIIHAHDFRASVICSMANKNIPLISHLHNNATWMKRFNLNSIAYLLSSVKYKEILLVSKSIEQEYIFRKLVKRKMKVIGNPINVEEIREKAYQEEGKKQYEIIFLGRLAESKDPIRFIEIIYDVKKQIPNLKVVMIGDGPLRNLCENKIKELQLNDTIELLGFVENPYPILAKSKILCMTSKWEGFGLVAAEALTLGKPVVATDVGGIPDFINMDCGKVYNNNNECIEEIIKLLKNEKYYKGKSNGAKRQIDKISNTDRYIENLQKMYYK